MLHLYKLSYAQFWLLISIFYAVAIIAPEYVVLSLGTSEAIITNAAKWIFISFVASGLICLISVNRYIFALAFPILITASSINTYFIMSIGVGISPGVVDLAMANAMPMWMTLINFKVVVVTLFSIALSILIVIYRWRHVKFVTYSPLDFIILGIVIICIPMSYSPRIKGAIVARMPFSFYNSISVFLHTQRQISEIRTTYNNTYATAPDNAPDVYIVIGESLRADHLPQNGYHRNTMPRLSADSTVISYRNLRSDSYFTHICLPIIMTDTDSLSRDKAYDRQSFITLFNKAGYRSAWFANQDLSDSYAVFAHEADTIFYCNNVMNVYNFSSYLDKDILPIFENWMTDRDNKPQLAVIHTIGSHWLYTSHYDPQDAIFKPELKVNDINSANHDEVINSYDNTIVATDSFLSALINKINDRNAIMIFISDHGENLGEHGEYLHVNGYDETCNPACLIWMSDEYRKQYPEKVTAAISNRLAEGNTDMMFHTIIDAAGMKTDAYNPRRSLVSPLLRP